MHWLINFKEHVGIQTVDRWYGPQPQHAQPLVIHKAIGFLNNSGADPLEDYKATKPAFKVGPSAHV